MQRIIKFRGKRIDNGKWIFGYYYFDNDGCYILESMRNRFEVIPESVGQFTGLFDKNKKEIYEGDIVKANTNTIRAIQFINGSFKWGNEEFLGFDVYDDGEVTEYNPNKWCEIIGNATDNPNLLEQK